MARAPSAASQRRRSQAAPSRGADRGRARTRVRFGAPYAGPLPLTMGPRHLAWAGRRLDAPQSQACQALAAPGAGGPAGPRSHRTFMPGAVRGPRGEAATYTSWGSPRGEGLPFSGQKAAVCAHLLGPPEPVLATLRVAADPSPALVARSQRSPRIRASHKRGFPPPHPHHRPLGSGQDLERRGTSYSVILPFNGGKN